MSTYMGLCHKFMSLSVFKYWFNKSELIESYYLPSVFQCVIKNKNFIH